MRLFFCGALPVSQLSWSDNGTDFKPFGAEIAARNAEPYGGISELRVTGNAHGRYVRLHIGGNRTEALRLFEIDVWSPELVPEQ